MCARDCSRCGTMVRKNRVSKSQKNSLSLSPQSLESSRDRQNSRFIKSVITNSHKCYERKEQEATIGCEIGDITVWVVKEAPLTQQRLTRAPPTVRTTEAKVRRQTHKDMLTKVTLIYGPWKVDIYRKSLKKLCSFRERNF